MTERREPRERPDRLTNRNHTPRSTNHTIANNPYHLTTAPPISATPRSPIAGAGRPERHALSVSAGEG